MSVNEFLYFIEKLKFNNSMIQNYISFTPFYKHKDFQLEVDERILYIECRNRINEVDITEFYEKCKCEDDFYNVDLGKRFFLVQKNDNISYEESLNRVISYLDILIPYILQRLKTEYNLKEADLLFGNLCFEIMYK
ncbi:MAG: hypothetical protein K6E69_09830 [Treponema sp.]|uniref:hypothetical protein n=1 Tax=Treponema sp. TaxID=166 RepID=UPI00298E441A|nr:hypothetical protein [Treponema sp.]MCR5387406.1 hypothetical protein [Treponema sp.]